MLELEDRMMDNVTRNDGTDDLDVFAGMTPIDEQEEITMNLKEGLQAYLNFASVEDLLRLVVNEVL